MGHKRNFKIDEKESAVIISALLFALASASLLYLLLPGLQGRSAKPAGGYVAEIYQNGELLYCISLSEMKESQTLVIKGEESCFNQIEIRPDSIGILSANCPDKLCIRQGFISDSRLPIVCLPNHLVIQLCPESDFLNQNSQDSNMLDGITY